MKNHDNTKSNDDSLIEFNNICPNYHHEEKETEHLTNDFNKDHYSFLLKNCTKKNTKARKTSNFSKKSKENPELKERKKNRVNNEYMEIKFNQHKENIHKFKDEFIQAKERKQQNNLKLRNQESELKNDVKIIINNTEYK